MRRASLVCLLAGLWPAAADDAALAKVAGWIRAGAEIGVAQRWAFAKPVRPAVTATGNPIDGFVIAAYKKHGLPPTGPADPRTLLRRVTIDLNGVPPSAEEMRAFLANNVGGAYERAFDRLLASPRYGERWGRHWVDIWRYFDWYGYRKSSEVRNGRDHHPYGFSVWLAGGGVKDRIAHGATDELGFHARSVSSWISARPSSRFYCKSRRQNSPRVRPAGGGVVTLAS